MILFISPPFGNYINLPNSKSVYGSFTLEARPGLLNQIFKTLRYSEYHQGWINKIGLRNKGLDYGIDKVKNSKKDILSIAILNKNEIPKFLEKIPEDMNLEINVSCPNLNKNPYDSSSMLSKFLNEKRKWCIVKLSPKTDIETVNGYYNNGFRQFHCSNTLPLGELGGLSGQSLIPYNNKLIKNIRDKFKDVTIISGGGISNMDIANMYLTNGANHISISTLCFNPIKLTAFLFNYYQNKK